MQFRRAAGRARLATITELLPVVFAATSNATRGRCDKGVDLTFSGYIDDELWWGIAWLRAFQLTANRSYLGRSVEIFDDATDRAWLNESCGGGVCWQLSKDENDMHKCYKNAITNELFLALAGGLALHHPDAAREKRSVVGGAAGDVVPEERADQRVEPDQRRPRHLRQPLGGVPEQPRDGVHVQPGRHPQRLASAWLAAKAAGEPPDDARCSRRRCASSTRRGRAISCTAAPTCSERWARRSRCPSATSTRARRAATASSSRAC